MAWSIGPFFLDNVTRELRCNDIIRPVEPKVFDLMEMLIENRDRLVTRDELIQCVWGGRLVSDASISSCIKSARDALDDDGRTQSIIKTIHGRGYRFVADVTPVSTEVTSADSLSIEAGTEELSIRFATAIDGFQSAIGITGKGPTLVKAANWLTHVELDTGSPVWGHWVSDLSRLFQFVRYDARGSGLSDRDLGNVSLSNIDVWTDDLRTVVDAVGIEKFLLLGVSQGGPVAIDFAHRYPDRVAGLILLGTYARGMKMRGDAVQFETANVQVDLARIGWGSDNDMFRQVFAQQFVPQAGPKEMAWFSMLLRETTDARNAPLLESAFHDLDVSTLARQIRVPTLVMHATKDKAVPFAEGRRLAGLIPTARFVPLDSDNHILDGSGEAWQRFIQEIARFSRELA